MWVAVLFALAGITPASSTGYLRVTICSSGSAIVRWNETYKPDLSNAVTLTVELRLCIAECAAGESYRVEYALATLRKAFLLLGPRLYDGLTYEALEVRRRSNVPLVMQVCNSTQRLHGESVMQDALKLVLDAAGRDSKTWSVSSVESTETLSTAAAVLLFTCNGLQSLLLTFITVPCVAIICTRLRPQSTRAASAVIHLFFTPLIVVSAVYVTMLSFYWGLLCWRYYSEDSYIDSLYPDKIFSPFTLHILFYGLTAIMSFLGGSTLTRRTTPKSKMTIFHRIGCGCVCVMLSTSLYHTIFVVLAMVYDPIAMLSKLVILITLFVVFLFGSLSLHQQYHKSKSKGFLLLIFILETIILLLYYVMLQTVYLLVPEISSSRSCLFVTVFLSVLTASFSCSIAYLITNKQQNATAFAKPADTECKQMAAYIQQNLMAVVMPENFRFLQEAIMWQLNQQTPSLSA